MSQRETIDCFISLASVWCYLGSRALQTMVVCNDVDLRLKPVDLRRITLSSGGPPAAEQTVQRQDYTIIELQRWSRFRDLPLAMWPTHTSTDASIAHRLLLAVEHAGLNQLPLMVKMAAARWALDLDLQDEDVLWRLTVECGLDAKVHMDFAKSNLARLLEDKATNQAIMRQVFGVPFFFYRNEPFWGQDRIDQLEDALIIGRPPFTLKPSDQPA